MASVLTQEQLKAVLISSRFARRPREGLQYNIFTNVHRKSVSRQMGEARKTYEKWISDRVLPVQAAVVLQRSFRSILDTLPILNDIVLSVLEVRTSEPRKRLCADNGEDGDDDDDGDDADAVIRRRKRHKGHLPEPSCCPRLHSHEGSSQDESSGYCSQPDFHIDGEVNPVTISTYEAVDEVREESHDDEPFTTDEATVRYLESCQPSDNVILSFEDLFRHYLSKSRGAQQHVTTLFKGLKKFRPIIDYDKLPATGPTVMKKGKKDLKGAKIYTVYEDNSASNLKKGGRVRRKRKDEVDIPDDLTIPCADNDVEDGDDDDVRLSSDSDDDHRINARFMDPEVDAFGQKRKIAGKYVHFGLENGIFGESIGEFIFIFRKCFLRILPRVFFFYFLLLLLQV